MWLHNTIIPYLILSASLKKNGSTKKRIISYEKWRDIRLDWKSYKCHKKKPMKIYVDNSLVIALTKDHIFHDRSKYIDTWFYYLRDYIKIKKIEIKYVKTQN
jgi:hypothetical protein